MISLQKLAAAACLEISSGPVPDISVRGVECDSRKVEKDFLFVAVRGTKQDGRAFAEEALKRGASAVVADEALPLPPGTPLLRVGDSRRALAKLADAFYSHPSKSLSVVGITGTNGKTTTSYLIEYLLHREGKSPGVIGTVNYRFAGKEIPAVETTPGPLRLQALLRQMLDAGCGYAVMEVSAHAIDQSRVEGVRFQGALFTNLTQDHLDYFGSIDKYFDCKAGFFKSMAPGQWAVLNADDARVHSVKDKTRARVLTFGIDSPADLKAESVETGLAGTRFRLAAGGRSYDVKSPLAGLHNVYNVLGALGVLQSLGFELSRVINHLPGFQGVSGRLERIERGQNFFVFVDYAHTPDGLENVLRSLRPYKKGKLITLFGCGGDRDRGKRPQMARIAGELSDFVVLTSDNPRSENPRAITEEIRAGFPEGFKDFAVVLDRRKAIRQALLSARADDIVLLAGKGHETVQVIGSESFPFSDKEEAERVLDGR